MAHTNTTTALGIFLASAIVASGIGAATPGRADAARETLTRTSITVAASARQDSTSTTTTTMTAALLEATETVIDAETEEQRQLAVWALDRYAEAGLELPILTIQMHSDRADCGGNNGYLTDGAGAEFVIHSCGNDFTLLHELGHAWDMHMLDDAGRDDFLEIAQATTWKNRDDWHLAGGEHAANVLAWGLMGERINQTRTRPYDYRSMMDAYSLLTDGGEPLWLTS
jgi:hypothetical protein